MSKSKALYDIFIEQVHTTALSFLFSEKKKVNDKIMNITTD
jgi:hypothetical protein